MVTLIYSKFRGVFRGLFPDLFDRLGKHKLIIKYTITSVSAAAVDVMMLFVVTEYLLASRYLWGAIIAFIISFGFAFTVQKYWTFGDFSDDNVHGQLFKYLLAVLFSLGLDLFILYALVEFARIHYLPAQIMALCVTGVFGFVISVRNVFHKSYYAKGVAVAAGIFPPDIGGPASHIHRLVNELAKEGVRSTVVTYSRNSKDTKEDGYDVIRISFGLPTILRGFAYLASLFVASVNYPVIFAQDVTSTGILAMIVKKILPQKKLVIRIGGDLLWERETETGKIELSTVDYYRSGKYEGRFIYKIGRIVMQSADMIIVPAEFLRDIYVKYYKVLPEKIMVFKNPMPDINLCDIPTTPEDMVEERVVLFAGRFIKLKNVDKLIKAFVSVYDSIKPARLVLIGDGPERGVYEEIINKWQNGSRVQILSSIPQDELFGYIRMSSLCVCSSWTDTNPNFILEALSLGRLVLLTRSNGLSVTLPEELLFSYDNQEELADKMKVLLTGGYDVSKLRKIVCDESHKLSWENLIRQYQEVLNF